MTTRALDTLLRAAVDDSPPDDAAALAHLIDAPLAELQEAASGLTLSGFGTRISYSRKVFIPLTQLCRNVCHYCTFAHRPRQLPKPYLELDDVLDVARAGAAAGCKEALFTLGDKPELRYRVARETLARLGHATTTDYVLHAARAVIEQTGLLPHINSGVLSADELARLRPHSVSMGLMLESAADRLCERGGPHFGSPDKRPRVRLDSLRAAGELRIPYTTGLLIGIGETRRERVEALLALRAVQREHGHLQELIVQNFRAKPGTAMAHAPEPPLEEQLWTIAVARLLFGSTMSIQAPPNLQPAALEALACSGINDWGGVSPVTPDFVNPEAPWPHLADLERRTQDSGRRAGRTPGDRACVCIARSGLGRCGVATAGAARDRCVRLCARGQLARRCRARWDRGTGGAAPRGVQARSERRARYAATSARRRDGRRVADRTAVRGARHRVCSSGLGRGRTAPVGRWRSRELCRQPQHQLHEHLHLSLRLLRLLEGTQRPQPARPRLPDRCCGDRTRTREAWEHGATEVCLQGGIHPQFTGETYLSIVAAVKDAVPEMHVHAFSPLEVTHGARTLGLELGDYLRRLQAAGLATLPGTAAEILDDDVRRIICPDKLDTEAWLAVMRSAHENGLRSTATIMYGHVDTPLHWARHLLRVRALQASTGGFTEFVPLAFVHMEAPLWRKGITRSGPTFREALLMHAVARLVLHPVLRSVQTSWVKMGPAGAVRCLEAGANDLGGTLMNESITRAAGGAHGQEMDATELTALAASIGREAWQRTTLYEPAPLRPSSRFMALAPLQTAPSASLASEYRG